MTGAQPALAPLTTISPPPTRNAAAAKARATGTPSACAGASDPSQQVRLEDLGVAIEEHATRRGLRVEHLGVEALHTRPRLYPHQPSPWVLCPAAHDPLVRAGLPIPARQRRHLDQLVAADMDFPHLYLAHEVPTGHPQLPTLRADEPYRTLSDAQAHQLIVRPDAPAAARKTATRLDQAARAAGRGMRLVGIGAGAVLAAPLVLLGSLGDGLDPAVLGAITLPDAGHAPGTPAAWFLLAHWDW